MSFAVALMVAVVVITLSCLAFGAWVLRRTGDPKALREAGRYIARIPHPRITIKLPDRRGRDGPYR